MDDIKIEEILLELKDEADRTSGDHSVWHAFQTAYIQLGGAALADLELRTLMADLLHATGTLVSQMQVSIKDGKADCANAAISIKNATDKIALLETDNKLKTDDLRRLREREDPRFVVKACEAAVEKATRELELQVTRLGHQVASKDSEIRELKASKAQQDPLGRGTGRTCQDGETMSFEIFSAALAVGALTLQLYLAWRYWKQRHK